MAAIITSVVVFILLALFLKPKNQQNCIPLSTIDADNDSLINSKEVLNAIHLHEEGKISREAVATVIDAWRLDARVTDRDLC